jgi:chemotaxis protein MotB
MDDRPIIVVKKVSGHAAHHGGAWKVAYADFVTAMMAFFLVMWILGLSSDQKEAIAAYFKDPIGFMKTHGGGRSPIAVSSTNGGHPSIMPSMPSILKGAGEGERFKAAKEYIEQKLAQAPEFRDIRNLVEVKITEDGLRVELIESREPVFFDTGSAHIRPQTVKLLHLIGRELATLPNRIAIEGHTDARPYASGEAGYSNWELSADRANAARRAIAPTLRSGQIDKVAGLADTRLRVPADPYHYSNRRISILVEAVGASSGSGANRGRPAGSIAPPPVNLTEGASASRPRASNP